MAGRLWRAAGGLSDYGAGAAGRGAERARARPASGVPGSVAGGGRGGARGVAAGSARQARGGRARRGRGGGGGDRLFEDRRHTGIGPPCLRPRFVAGDRRAGRRGLYWECQARLGVRAELLFRHPVARLRAAAEGAPGGAWPQRARLFGARSVWKPRTRGQTGLPAIFRQRAPENHVSLVSPQEYRLTRTPRTLYSHTSGPDS